MRKRTVKGLEVEKSSGNVFADLGLRDAKKLKIKSGLVIQIIKAVRRLGLSRNEAGRRMGLPQSKISGLFRGDFANVSERKLMDCLRRLRIQAVRTDIVIDDKLIAEALKFTGIKTKRRVVEAGLELLVKMAKQEQIRFARGKLRWEGGLNAMRRDR